MSPNFCLPHSVPCPAGGKRPSSALSTCRSHKFAIGRFETSKNASTAWIFVVFERERTIFERSRSPFKVLGLLTSANSIGDWGLAGNSLVTSCSLDTPCMRQCNLFNIRHPFAGNKNSVVLPRGSRSEEEVLPDVCVRQRGPPRRVDLGFLARLLFLFSQVSNCIKDWKENCIYVLEEEFLQSLCKMKLAFSVPDLHN
ncbi:uncharacterized protein K444DRAFT_31266 [Hyaloscypha bicolor E]|uniref:Uncharacterized protein n=1 Tax=Hyaloscypha bicolor E TaxID=1095630 RepID=A0A2J6T3K5_9HELO|nr:uncharacterized protein K444DRAFT_31266 [Hyaloscypha bicolor E]PMD57620.1 hypothetical protein K444DRAFT_31266 [Hyaloscypha bicolor E]